MPAAACWSSPRMCRCSASAIAMCATGSTVPLKFSARAALDIASRPRWALRALGSGQRTFGNLAGKVGGANAGSLAQWIGSQFDGAMRWSDVEWLRGIWPGKLVVKGVLNATDAEHARRSGADGIVVSNHGGRQLDGAPSSIAVLERVAQKVGGNLEIIVDSGFRSGQDVMRALALGARACMIGRAPLFGLAANGQAGVATALDIIRKGTQRHHGALRRQYGGGDRPARSPDAALSVHA